MYALSIQQQGMGEIRTKMNRLLQTVSDLRPVWPDVHAEVLKIEQEQFSSEGAAGGSGKWAPLSERYRIRKARMFPGAPLLVRTGRLRSSMVRRTSDSFVEMTPKRLVVGSTVPYGIFHQTGTGRMPARSPYSLSNRQAARIQAVLHRYFNRQIQKSGSERVSAQRGLVGA